MKALLVQQKAGKALEVKNTERNKGDAGYNL